MNLAAKNSSIIANNLVAAKNPHEMRKMIPIASSEGFLDYIEIIII